MGSDNSDFAVFLMTAAEAGLVFRLGIYGTPPFGKSRVRGWKAPPTGRLESLPYTKVGRAAAALRGSRDFWLV